MTRLMSLGRSALLGWLLVAGWATMAQAGLLDRVLGNTTESKTVRGQSPYRQDAGVETELEFCGDCDHNPNPWKTRQCRKGCGATYYPAQRPYCAPCYGVYPTCWRRLEECWMCPQERFTTRPSKSGRSNAIEPGGLPPAPAATPYVPAAPTSPVEETPAVTPPSIDPADEITPPAADEARRIQRTPRIQQASQTRPAAARSAPVAPAASEAPQGRAKTVEELLRDLQ